jgi:GNAT superfamily N-acetyltransferase
MRSIEEMSMNAWPALETVLYDGWVLRFAEGFTRRANSVNPIYPSSGEAAVKIGTCERLYASKGLRTIFKITPAALPESLDELLAARGYKKVNETSLMALDLKGFNGSRSGNFKISAAPEDNWVYDACSMNGIRAADMETMKKMLRCIVHKCFFVSFPVEGKTAACGMAVIENGHMGLFDIVVDRDMRGRGLGRRLMEELLCLGKAGGASTAYLQVMVENLPAVGLYESMGFGNYYKYWYRTL